MKITSSNLYLQNLTDWALNKTEQFIMTGKTGPVNLGDGNKYYGPPRRFSNKSRAVKKTAQPWAQPKKYIPSYWAGYYDRTAFYIRDFVHQAPGAEFSGYHEENYEMLNSFISLVSKETDGYAPWALNFDGSIYYMDTPNYKRFVRELTAQYELVEVICKLYLLTDDKRYLNEKFFNFAENILGKFTSNRDNNKNTIPEGCGNIWKGSASYNEGGKVLLEAGDCIGALYKALKFFGGLLHSLGRAEKANEYINRANELKRYFNEEWSVAPNGGYVFAIDKSGKKYYEWTKSITGIVGAETCFIMPIKEITEPGERNDKLLEYINERANDPKTCMPNIESYTYLPQVFFPYHKAENAWYWLKYIGDRIHKPHVKASQGENGDYPEVSFTLISHTVEGLLGFSADIPNKLIETYPCLPDEINDISVQELTLGKYSFNISVSKNSAEFTNNSEHNITWKCKFAGVFNKFTVNGQDFMCEHETANGVQCSFITVTVPSKASVHISII